MELRDDEIIHLENLSKIRLDPESRWRLKADLSRMIDFVNKVRGSAIDTPDSDTAGAGCNTGLRADRPAASLDPEEILKEAPDRKGDYFRVPPVISGDD